MGTFAPVPVTAAAENAQDPPASHGGQRRKNVAQCIRRVGIVDIDKSLPIVGDRFETSGYNGGIFDPGPDGSRRNIKGNRYACGTENVFAIVATHQRGAEIKRSRRRVDAAGELMAKGGEQ